MSEDKKQPLLAIIDGKSVFYRGYYAMPNLSTRDGMPTGGVYGFTAMSVELIKRLKPDYVAVAWDKAKTNIRSRKAIYPEYKAGRKPAPPDFYDQIPILNELLEGFGWPLYELDDYEADDILGTLAKQANEKGIEVALITSDLDALQLVSDKTKVYALKKGLSNIDLFDVKAFEDKYHIGVHQFLDLKSLKGDSSDNLPGVPGIGEKTALDLLRQFKTLDGVYENLDKIKETTRAKLEAGRDSAYMTKKVAEIWCDAPLKLDLKSMDVKNYDRVKLKELLLQLEFKGLLNRLSTELSGLNDLKASGQKYEKSTAKTKPLKTPELIEIDGDKKLSLLKPADEVIIGIGGDKLWLGDKKRVHVINLEKISAEKLFEHASPILSSAKLAIGNDLKSILHGLESLGFEIKAPLFDVKIAGFLLDSLIRDKSLTALFGEDIDEDDPGEYTAAVSELYETQKHQLKKLPKLDKLAEGIEFPVIKTLAKMEQKGIKLDLERLKDLGKETNKLINQIEKEIFSLTEGEFNLNSPSQLSEVLFSQLGLPTNGIKKGKTGYSTGAKELDKLILTHEIIPLILKYRELAKLKSTYIDALPKFADKSHRLHTDFALDVAATGRLSSQNPNLQNIPVRSEMGNKIRECFVPENGNVFVSADYSQFELRLAAVLAGDKQMIADFESGADIHSKTASDIFGTPIDKVDKNQRRAAKVINFGVLYGMGPHALSQNTGMSFGQSKQFIDDYFELRKPLKKYIERILEQAKDKGYVETLLGRRRPTPDVNSSNFVVREAAKRAAANMPIQGTEADLMKMAMIKLDEQFDRQYAKSKKQKGSGVYQILQIHDSILVECPEKEADKVGQIMRDVMENIYPSLGISLKVDITSGDNWGEL